MPVTQSTDEHQVPSGLNGQGDRTPPVPALSDEDLCDSLLVVSAIRSRLGEMLLSAKQITSAQLESALEVQRKRGGLLGEILVSHGSLDHETLDVALAAQARSGRKAA